MAQDESINPTGSEISLTNALDPVADRSIRRGREGVFSRTVLYVLALVVVLATIVGAMIFVGASASLKISHGFAIALALSGALVGLVIAGVLLGIGNLLALQQQQVRILHGLHNSVDHLRGRVDEAHRDIAGRLMILEEGLQNLSTAGSMGVERATSSREPISTSSTDSHSNNQMVELLMQLRDFGLMNDQQRKVAADQYWEKKKGKLAEVIRQHMHRRDWRKARERINELLAAAPDDPLGHEFSEHLEQQKKAEVSQVVLEARNEVGALISVGEWDKVRELIKGLCARYPDEPSVTTLVEQVRREEHAARIDELQRLFATLKDATEHRQWHRAMMCARQLIERYPDEKLVDRIRSDLPTLEQNARIQERKEEEAMFQDLLHRQRYEEAMEVANRIVEKFPDSAAAVELTSRMIPKVQELARQERIKRQQTSGKENT